MGNLHSEMFCSERFLEFLQYLGGKIDVLRNLGVLRNLELFLLTEDKN